MATFMIFGEIGTNEVRWEIPNFGFLIKELTCNNNNEFKFIDATKKFTLKMSRFDSTYTVRQGLSASDFFSVYANNATSQANLNAEISLEYVNIYTHKTPIVKKFEIGTKVSGKELGFPRRVHDQIDYRNLNATMHLVWTPDSLSKPICSPVTKPVSQSAVVGVADDLEKAFSNMQFADIQLLCNGEKFGCHKVILAARSPVFNAMFNNEMKENINNEVKLDSMNAKILKEMLSYIYCGKVKDFKEASDAMELLKVADQFQLEGLKEICGLFLCNNLKADNALDMLTLAESCNENLLKKSTMEWLVKNQNIKSLMKTARWEELEEKFPRLLVDVMKVVVDKKL